MNDSPKDPLSIALEQGFSLLREGMFEDAIDTFTTAIALDPACDQALRGRGLARLQLKQYAPAEADFAAAFKSKPADPENAMGLGLSLAVQNRIYDAMKVYEELIAQVPTHVPAHVQLGTLEFKIGAIAKGRDYLNKALTLRPTLAQRRAIEAALKEQEKLDKGRYYRPDFERLNREAPESAFSRVIKKALSRFKK